MNTVRDSIWLCCVLCVALATGCGKDADPGNTKDAGDNGAAGEPGEGNAGEPSEPAAGSGGSDAPMDAGPDQLDASQDAGEFTPDPEFEGIPNDSVVSGAAAKGCTDRSGADGDTLVLGFTSESSTMQLAAQDGMVQVNGIKCVALKSPKAIKITGGAALETLIIDFSLGDFPESMRDGTISVDLGAGKDVVAIAGTYNDDDVQLGTQNGLATLRIAKNLPKITVKNQESLIVSTGPGDDHIDATGSTAVGTALNVAFTAYGGAGNDMLTGGVGADVLHGGEGDDLLKTAATADGGDVYDGGRGLDILTYELRNAPIVIKVDRVANDGETNERDDVQDSVETLIGGKAADNITGGDADNTLIGGPGNDTLNGGNGDDTFLERGSSAGSDIMNGGAGADTIDYAERSADLTVTLCISAQAACAAGACGCAADDGESGEKDVLANIENAMTGSGNDKLYGSAADNVFSAGDGDDELRGEAGDDTMYGDGGDDILIGGPGEDMLNGDAGNDIFDAGEGGDICVLAKTETPKGCELY